MQSDVREMLAKRARYLDTAANIYQERFVNGQYDAKDHRELMKLISKANVLADQINNQLGPNGTPVEIVATVDDLERVRADLDKPLDPLLRPAMGDDLVPQNARPKMLSHKESKSYKNLFYGDQNTPLDRGGFANFNEYLTILHSKMYDPRFIKNLQEGIGEAGGFLVPEEFGAFLWDKSLESEIVRPRATVWPMESESRRVPAWNNFDHSESVYGGITGKWLGETEDAGNEVDPKLREIRLMAHRLACYAKVSDALLADSNIDQLLTTALITGLSWYLDIAFLTGDGVAKPLGVLNDPALITVPRTTAGQIKYTDLCNMFARMAPACLTNSVWVANQTTIPQLLSLVIQTGTDTGDHIPVLREDGKGGFTLLTRPVIFTEKVPSLGQKGDIGLYDFSQYAIGVRKELSIDRTNAVYWKTSETAYRVIARVDGKGTWSEPITPRNGDPLSWCVTLDA